ncbi:hypothetical protein [Pararobbsia alpina]|uniref:hypothetical protein n=1 Tax=Pararobbsia alpina TaxID=621374 RepID=UPI001581E21D|nr:hypothetical protein [Pararobbsia alpina]
MFDKELALRRRVIERALLPLPRRGYPATSKRGESLVSVLTSKASPTVTRSAFFIWAGSSTEPGPVFINRRHSDRFFLQGLTMRISL